MCISIGHQIPSYVKIISVLKNLVKWFLKLLWKVLKNVVFREKKGNVRQMKNACKMYWKFCFLVVVIGTKLLL